MDRVDGLYGVGLGVPDLDAAAHFYREVWGMEPAGGTDCELWFRSVGEDHGDLVLRESDDAGLEYVALAVEDKETLLRFVDKIEAAGNVVLEPGGVGARPWEALVAAVEDADGNRVELVVPAASEGNSAAGRSRRRLGHIVLWTEGREAQEAFYALLGFQVSDRTHIGMSFLRCNNDHHSIAIAESGGKRHGLQHIAYDIGTVDDVMREFGRMRAQGIECIWGVGRHGPGNNVFSYYRDPAGNVVEYYGDMEEVEDVDVSEPQYWGPEHKGDIWGVAGPPPAAFRG